MTYRIKFTHTAEKKFIALPKSARMRIAIALGNYAADPFHRQDIKKVKGCPADKPRYRIRVGEYRATFRIMQDQLIICVVAVGKKKNFEY